MKRKSLPLAAVALCFGLGLVLAFLFLPLKECGLLRNIRWRTPQSCEVMVAQLRGRHMSVAQEQPWYDIDTLQGLRRTQEELKHKQIHARCLSSALTRIGVLKAVSA